MVKKGEKNQSTAIIILGHGSPVSEANHTLLNIARRVKEVGGYDIVQPAFLQFEHPNLSEAVDILVAKGYCHIIVMPYFLYMGAHVTKDLPYEIENARRRHQHLEICLAPNLGDHKKLVEVAVERIEETKVRSSKFKVQNSKFNLQHATHHSPHTTRHSLNQHPIERESFRIISEQLDESRFSQSEIPIVKRVIHATADFEFEDTLVFHPDAIEIGIKAIKSGKAILTDVEMVRAGINKRLLSKWGGKVICSIQGARSVGLGGGNETRAALGIEAALQKNKNIGIIAIGNAPTALLKVIDIFNNSSPLTPYSSLVVGVPLGFVNAEESKDRLIGLDIPHIAVRGKKGGSVVAVAIVNALLMLAEDVSN